mmetsp:Transcript_47413/g.125504  ORF Transcript_47413/g.125504 Transcript_47413/m.125504 type:complete len:175 (+) Transcript_47413:490-1014(+)
MSRAAFDLLRATGPGTVIINLTHPRAHQAVAFQAHAISAKAGIDRLTDVLGLEWAEYGIRVVGIAPGPVSGTEGGPTGRVFGGAKKEKTEAEAAQAQKREQTRLLSTCPIGRYGERDDVTNAALFFASPAASWCTACTVPIDGGYRNADGGWFMMKPAIKAMQAMQKKPKQSKL